MRSGFPQRPGTHPLRIAFLPSEEASAGVMGKMQDFHARFMTEWNESVEALRSSEEACCLDNLEKLYGGEAPREGEIFRNPELAAVLEQVGANGSFDFYRGATADALAGYFAEVGIPRVQEGN